MFDTVLFDFDGTLLNSNRLIEESHLQTLQHYYPDSYSRQDVQKFNGPPLIKTYKSIDETRYEEMIAYYRAYNLEHHDEYVQLFPGVVESLKKLRQAGLKLGVVSTKSNFTLLKGLALFDLASFFDVLIDGDSTKNHKPDPEPIETALKLLNSKATNAVMIGDNWQDIEGANNAHVQGVFVEWSAKPIEQILPYKPSKTVKTMEELTEWILDNSKK